MPQSSRVTLQKQTKQDWKCRAWEIDQVDSRSASHRPIIACTVNISTVLKYTIEVMAMEVVLLRGSNRTGEVRVEFEVRVECMR